ncbi:MAG: peptidase C15 [Cyanobacteria bacterium P01_D01_bin.1]
MTIPTTNQTSTEILITSFVPWLAHQTSNSSDDLVAALYKRGEPTLDSVWLRHVPVCFDRAPALVIRELQRLRPRAIVCCGMAEDRSCLSIEQQATCDHQTLQTSVNVQNLIRGTTQSEISYNAGDYVCNHLYYQVLAAIDTHGLDMVAIFVHVPILTSENTAGIVSDFLRIISTL